MSASYRKDRVFALAICQAPPNLSKEAFEKKVTSIVDTILALPISQKSFLKFELNFQTGLINEHVKALGFPEGSPNVLVTVEYAAMADLFEFPTVAEGSGLPGCSAGGKNDLYGDHPAVNAFLANVETRLDRPIPKDRARLVCVLKRPENLSEEGFHQAIRGFADKLVSLPIAQRLCVHHSVWMPTSTGDAHMLALGFPASEPDVVIFMETEDQDKIFEGLMDPDVKQYVADASRELKIHVGSSFFSANVVNKINK
ncbi:hypothetical protein MSAN_02502300 [Mycena sanguinolenta]|uniref:Uncharacterized protein n=1 Tax=Mycena sanguinolenta TaxID=230812 RepID=A0A8H6WQ30_9AGAR|nr:hypothetical protein MSAN_02502300 [Mycena sanguinolenta]